MDKETTNIDYSKIILEASEKTKEKYHLETPHSIIIDNKRGLDKREIKMIIFTTYDDKGNYKIRKKIILVSEDPQLKEGKYVNIKWGKTTTLGRGKIEKISGNEVTLIDLEIYDKNEKDNYTNEANILFKDIEKEEIKDYTDFLFKIYYKSVENQLLYMPDYDPKENHNKFNAMCTYLAFRDVLKEKGYNLSESNVFIKDKKIEYDVLILNKNSDNNGIYNKEDIKYSVELKTSGYRKNFNDSIEKNNKDNFEDYLTKEKTEGITHIYYSNHESARGKNNRYEEYSKVAEELISEEIIVIFGALMKDSEYFYVPKKYKLEDFLMKNSRE